ncbi:MAG: glycosyl transferase family 2, partial [Leptolyngbya sp. ERB_1_2]
MKIAVTPYFIYPLRKGTTKYLLFRLNTVRAVVWDVPMRAKYDNEISSLSIGKVILEFPFKYLTRLLKRIFYTYFLRNFNVGSVELVIGLFLITIGVLYGGYSWYRSLTSGIVATSGTVMTAALPIILGFQLLLAAIHYDVMNVPKEPMHRLLSSDFWSVH